MSRRTFVILFVLGITVGLLGIGNKESARIVSASGLLKSTLTSTPNREPPRQKIAADNAQKVVELWRIGSGNITALAWSPDGTLLATGSDQGIGIFDPYTPRFLYLIKGSQRNIWHLAFSPDNVTLASSDQSGVISLWNARTGTLIRSLKGHAAVVNALAFSPDGTLLASGAYDLEGKDNTVRIWDVKTGAQLKVIQESLITELVFSLDGNLLAGGTGGGVILWNTTTYQEVSELTLGCCVYAVAFSPDGKLIAAGGWDWNINIWDVKTGAIRTKIPVDRGIYDIAFSPDGSLLLASQFGFLFRVSRILREARSVK